jgi:hypothetical protein
MLTLITRSIWGRGTAVGNRLAKPAAVSARVLLAAGLGALGWTFFSTTTAAASDESAGTPALEAPLQTMEKPAAELTDPAAAAVDAVVGRATSGLTETVVPAAQPAPADLGVVQEIGTLAEDVAPVVQAPAAEVVQTVVPATEVVQTVVPTAEAVVQELDSAVEHLDTVVQDAGLPAVLPEEPLNTVTDAVVGQLDEAVAVVTVPVEVVAAPVEQVLEPVTDELRPAVPILPESPAVPVTDPEPAPAEPTPAESVHEPAAAVPEPATQIAKPTTEETSPDPRPEELTASPVATDGSLSSDGPDTHLNQAPSLSLQEQSPSAAILQLPASDGGASITSATELPSPTAGPIPVASFPVTSGGSSGGGGGGSAGHSADFDLTGGQYQWLAAALTHSSKSTALPGSPVFDPGSTPD